MGKKDPAAMQTASGIPKIKEIGTSFLFSEKEKQHLKKLGDRTAQIAALPVQKEKAELWRAHNDLKTSEPVVFIDPENGWNECIPGNILLCEDPLARVWEMHLRKQIYWFEQLKDDKVIENYFDVPYSYSDTGWGPALKKAGGEAGGAYKVVPVLNDYEKDLPGIHYPELLIDYEESERVMELAHELFDGILRVRRKTDWWWSLGLTMDYINLRGLEDFMCDFLSEPESVHRTMHLLCEGVLRRLDFLEEHKLLAHNQDGTYVGSGGLGYTDDLQVPDKTAGAVTAKNMWGFVESQETTAINPDLYGEFIFPYHKKIARRFGLNCSGCCEPYEPRWKYIKKLPNLRRVSCSPWSDWTTIPENLGQKYIASVKPTLTPLALPHMDEEYVRKEIRKALRCTRDCVPEIIMKDNHTLGKNPKNASRWVEIVREEVGGSLDK
ncbi:MULTISPECIES: uroporphyrinogen decarboxylase family protein [Lachnospiraceae]|nr:MULTISPECIES: uroporphyrinogen decarboxylase family protein [Clostridia]GKH33912.1 hypothetical protein CE91St64_33190 [Faecalicatena contorta]